MQDNIQGKPTPPEGYLVRYDNQTGKPYFVKKDDFERQESAGAFEDKIKHSAPREPGNPPPSAPAGEVPAAPPITQYGAYTYTPGEMLPGAVESLRGHAAPAPGDTALGQLSPSLAGAALDRPRPPFTGAPAPDALPTPAAPRGDAVRDVYGPGDFAGFFTRLAAYAVDWALAGLLSLLGGWMFGGVLSALGADTAACVLFHFTAVQIFRYLLVSAYFVVPTALTGGTAGKLLLRIRVVRADGQKIGWWTALYRETIGRYLTSLLCVGYFVLAFDGKHRGFHDMLCDTRVVFAEKTGAARTAANQAL